MLNAQLLLQKSFIGSRFCLKSNVINSFFLINFERRTIFKKSFYAINLIPCPVAFVGRRKSIYHPPLQQLIQLFCGIIKIHHSSFFSRSRGLTSRNGCELNHHLLHRGGFQRSAEIEDPTLSLAGYRRL